ncbi:MAG: hypothetical protein HOG49_43270 [Candidatus Scalindua sp.]|nr:hypothetical protein [Candidatus Scalindua sp.]
MFKRLINWYKTKNLQFKQWQCMHDWLPTMSVWFVARECTKCKLRQRGVKNTTFGFTIWSKMPDGQ